MTLKTLVQQVVENSIYAQTRQIEVKIKELFDRAMGINYGHVEQGSQLATAIEEAVTKTIASMQGVIDSVVQEAVTGSERRVASIVRMWVKDNLEDLIYDRLKGIATAKLNAHIDAMNLEGLVEETLAKKLNKRGSP